MYKIIFSKTALDQLKKLEINIKERIINSIERIRIRPERYIKKLVGLPYYRLKVGEYRVIINIENEKLTILVVYIGHRKKIYKKLK